MTDDHAPMGMPGVPPEHPQLALQRLSGHRERDSAALCRRRSIRHGEPTRLAELVESFPTRQETLFFFDSLTYEWKTMSS